MWESIVLTVVATAGNNIGKILQKKGTVILPPLSFKFKACFSFRSSIFFFPFSYAHDLLPLQSLTFEHNYSISSTRMCFSLMWVYLNPETYNLSVFFWNDEIVCVHVPVYERGILGGGYFTKDPIFH